MAAGNFPDMWLRINADSFHKTLQLHHAQMCYVTLCFVMLPP